MDNPGPIMLKARIFFWLLFAGAVLVAAGILVFSDKLSSQYTVPNDHFVQKKLDIQEKIDKPEPLKILFGGDIFLDRSVRRSIENGNDVWAGVEDFLKSYKYKVANLEGPVWNTPQPAPTGSFSFAFQEEYVKKLKDLGFTALSLANNHTLNQGQKGLDNTITFLSQIGIYPFGDPNNQILGCCRALIYENGELRLPDGSDFSADGKFRKSDERFGLVLVGEHDLIRENQDAILEQIRVFKTQGFFVIVLPHWGPEYVLTIPRIQQVRAHALIDAGADLIIGAHPHVVQPIEVYNGKVIFYSLGNFLFDQWFSYDTLHGLLVEVVFEEHGLRFVLHPTQQNRQTYQITLAPEEDKVKMWQRLAENSVGDVNKEAIIRGEFMVNY